MKLATPILLCVLAVGCRTAESPQVRSDGAMNPVEAILAAAEAAPRSVPGRFALRVRASGREGGRVYLNSELDYRDQRNLTISIHPGAADALRRRHQAPPDSFFVGRSIVVRGAARRVRIDFTAGGRPTGKYYYQTHVAVNDPDQIALPPQPD